MDQLPYSQACENNKGPILEILERVLAPGSRVLEIGAGTGQHASWFSQHLPQLHWQPTDIPANLPLLRPRCEASESANLLPPLELDVSRRPWAVPAEEDAIFTANSLHIMPWASVEDLFAELGERARAGNLLAIYGPFNYRGQYTSESNARFDQWLAQKSPHSAIRHFEEVDALARAAGYRLQEDNEMPANNRLLLFAR